MALAQLPQRVSVVLALLWFAANSAELAFAAACAQHASCNSCVLSPSWLSNCRWCPLDHRCHALGSGYSPCSSDQGIVNASSCPDHKPSQTEFDVSIAYEMLLHSNAAYSMDPSSQILPPSFSVQATFNFTIGHWDEAFAYIGFDAVSRRIVISFRGSNTLTQLSQEILHSGLVQLPSASPGVMVNEFFLHASIALGDKLMTELVKLRSLCEFCHLYITGHSLGGSMAILAGDHIRRTYSGGLPRVYTFGSPRVGNAAFTNWLNDYLPQLFRIVNAADGVPHVPPCSYNASLPDPKPCLETKDAYYHAGVEIWFPSGDYQDGVMCGYRECLRAPRSEDASCSDSLFSASYTPSKADHSRYFDIIPSGFCANSTKRMIII